MIAHYERQVAAHTVRRDLEIVRSIRISRLRLATVIPGVALLVVAGARTFSPAALIAGLALLLIFVVLVVWHAKVDQRVAWHDALRTVNLHALARVGRAWDHLPPAEDPPPEIEHHHTRIRSRPALLSAVARSGGDYAGIERCVGFCPAPAPAIADRQRAVAELAAAVECEYRRWAAHAGVRRADSSLSLGQSAGPFDRRPRRGPRGGAGDHRRISILITLQAAGLTEAAYWLIPLVIGMILSFVTAVHVHREFNRALVVDQAFARYADLFAHAVHAPHEATLLGALRTRLAPSGSDAPECLRRLNRILGFAQLRAGAAIFHFPVQALTLWDFHVFFALDRWRRRPSVRGWMEAIGKLGALSALAQVSRQSRPVTAGTRRCPAGRRQTAGRVGSGSPTDPGRPAGRQRCGG